MSKASSYLRAALLGLATLGVVAVIVRWYSPSGSSAGAAPFTTPEACLDAFRDAKSEGNAAAFLRCLDEPLRSEMRRKYGDERELGLAIRKEMKEVKSWAVKERPEARAEKGAALVEEVCASRIREVRVQLRRTGEGWLIAAIESGEERPASVPYGTAVGEEPEGKK
jgi:hypothetical protein